MQGTLRRSLLLLSSVAIALATLSHSSAADFSAVWDGGNGNWGDPLHWNKNPNYPNNTGGITYDATINGGNVTLDRNITIQRLFFNGATSSSATLSGAFELTLNEGLSWTGGTIGSTTINLASGSTSNISGGNAFTHILHGTINNAGTVNQTTYLRYFNGVINNSAGAVWNFDALGINGVGGMFSVPPDGQFNNAGSLLVAGTSFFGATKQFNTTLNNSGIVTLQSPANGSYSFYVYKGSATGAFNVASQAELQFGNYSLATGATISGAGVTNVKGTLDIIGNATISSIVFNNGNVTIQPGITLTLAGPFTQGTAGTVGTYLRNATLTSAQLLNFEAGKLMGVGTINGNVSVGSNAPNVFTNSVVTPGDQANAIGTFTVNGSFSLLNTAKIVMDISGGASPTNDLLALAGSALLDGILELHISAAQFNPKQTLTLLTSSDLAGVFDNVANGERLTSAEGTTSFRVNYGAGSPYGANNLVLSDPQGVPEPASLTLFAGGIGLLGLLGFRKR